MTRIIGRVGWRFSGGGDLDSGGTCMKAQQTNFERFDILELEVDRYHLNQ